MVPPGARTLVLSSPGVLLPGAVPETRRGPLAPAAEFKLVRYNGDIIVGICAANFAPGGDGDGQGKGGDGQSATATAEGWGFGAYAGQYYHAAAGAPPAARPPPHAPRRTPPAARRTPGGGGARAQARATRMSGCPGPVRRRTGTLAPPSPVRPARPPAQPARPVVGG
jgi:hypothetical protein